MKKLIRKARSEDGHEMIMFQTATEPEPLYAIMFNRLPCVNPSSLKHTEKMWQRHFVLYKMKIVQVKPNEKVPSYDERGGAAIIGKQ